MRGVGKRMIENKGMEPSRGLKRIDNVPSNEDGSDSHREDFFV